jgi:hypothetical protein
MTTLHEVAKFVGMIGLSGKRKEDGLLYPYLGGNVPIEDWPGSIHFDGREYMLETVKPGPGNNGHEEADYL